MKSRRKMHNLFLFPKFLPPLERQGSERDPAKSALCRQGGRRRKGAKEKSDFLIERNRSHQNPLSALFPLPFLIERLQVWSLLP